MTTTIIPKQALLILLFATMTLSACGSIGYVGYVHPAPGKDACALLTTDEIEHATGRQLLSSRPYQHGEFPSSCTWIFASGSYDPIGPNPTWLGVDLSYRHRGDFDSYLAEENKPSGEQSAAPISGLGDQALVVSLRLSRELWVRRGSVVLVIVVSVSTTTPFVVSTEQKLAKLALPRA
jgi:hypothetical protein